jgi:hypothetical protein
MCNADRDKLAEEVMEAYGELNIRRFAKGRFPMSHFNTFSNAVVRYADASKNEKMIHKNVAGAVNGFREILELESSRAPGKAIAGADRLECILFSEYDPHFEGDEPPGF